MKQIALLLFIVLVCSVQPLLGQDPDPPTNPPTQVPEEETPTDPPDTLPDEKEDEEEEPIQEENQDTEIVTPLTEAEEGQSPGDGEHETENASPSLMTEEIPVDPDITDPTPSNEETELVEPPEDNTPSQPSWQGRRRMFKIVNDFLLKPDETMTTLVLIAGNATIQGTVTGNVLVIGGNVEIVPGAQVNGLLQVISGEIKGNLDTIKKENVRISNQWQMVPAVAHLLMHPHTIWDIKKHRNFQLTLQKFVILLVSYLLIAAIFSKPINAVSSMLTDKPIGSILFSLLMFIAIPAVAVVLILSIIGYPFLLLCICLLVPVALCGKAAIFLTLGSTLLAGRLKPLAVVFGFIPYFMATEIPYVDWIAFLAFNGVGIGICTLTALNAMYQTQTQINWAERVR